MSDGLTERSRKDGVKDFIANSFVTLGDSTSALRVGTDLSSRTQVTLKTIQAKSKLELS